MKSNIIEIDSLNKQYGKKKALNNISLVLQKGRIIGLVGPNGAGKTTLLKILSNLIKWDSGTIDIDNESLEFNKPVSTRVGVLIENPSLYPDLTGRDHLEIFSILSTIECDFNKIIKEFELEDFVDIKTKDYSMGMRQRLGIAIALIHNPEIILLDEPFNGLDPESVHNLRKTLLQLKKQNKTIILSSHLIREISDIIDDIIIINHGNLRVSTSIQEILGKSQDINDLETIILKLM